MWVDAGNSGRVCDLPCVMGQPGLALLNCSLQCLGQATKATLHTGL